MIKSILGYQILTILSLAYIFFNKKKQKSTEVSYKALCIIPNDLEMKALKFIEKNAIDYKAMCYKSLDRLYLNFNQEITSNFIGNQIFRSYYQISTFGNTYLT